MTPHEDAYSGRDEVDVVRPVGAWVVGGFLIFVSLAIWFLVAVIFMHRA